MLFLILRVKGAWHPKFKINLICVQILEVFTPNLVLLGLTISEILLLTRTDGHGYIDLACRPDQEYMVSATPPSACYILLFLTNLIYPPGYKKIVFFYLMRFYVKKI